MTVINALASRVADVVLEPMASWAPWVVLLGAALLTAVGVLGVMRVASNQSALAAVKRQIHAALLEMRLYNDDLAALLRAQGDVLRHNARYVWLSLVPLVITALPLTLLVAQPQAWYGYSGLTLGEPTSVTAVLATAPAAGTLPSLESPALEVQGPPRYFPTLSHVVWRVVPRAPGPAVVRIEVSPGTVVEKTLHVGATDTARRSPFRDRGGFVSQLLYPSESPLDASSAVAEVRVPYTDRIIRAFGVDTHWLIPYLLLTFAFVLLLRKPLGVVI